MSAEQCFQHVLIQLSTDRELEPQLVALIAEVIAADAHFNQWMAVDGKRTLSEDAMLNTIDVYEDTWIKCRGAIERFTSSRDRDALQAALTDTLQSLRKCRSMVGPHQ